MTNIRSIARILILIAAGSAAGVALAQGPGYWQGQGAGSGYGPGMGPGMMGGHRDHMGPGTMHGRGAGMMRGRWERMAQALGLSEDQRAKMRGIMEDTRRKNWDVLGQIRSERFKLREMLRGDKVDPNAAVEQKRKVDDLRREIMRSRLEARNQVLALLTPEQREKARAYGPRRWSGHGRG